MNEPNTPETVPVQTLDPSQLKDRLTVVESVYHQPFGEQPSQFDSRFSRMLETSEQPYQRRIKVGEAWQPLDLGWITDGVSHLVIQNVKPTLVANPTSEEAKAIERQVLEISLGSNGAGHEKEVWFVPPGESLRGCPADPSQVFLRCQSGEAKVNIFIVPR